MLISEFSAPPSSPAHSAPPQPRPTQLDALDTRIVEALRIRGRYGAGVWEVINALADAYEHKSRADLRATRLAFWSRLRGLLRLKMIFRQGRTRISLCKLPAAGASRRRRKRAGSTSEEPVQESTSIASNYLSLQLPELSQPTSGAPPVVPKTKSAHSPAEVTQAARSLAQLPRRPRRRWSGWIGATRAYRNLPILLPDQREVYVFAARRGKVLFTSQPDGPIGSIEGIWRDWGVVRASQVGLLKNEAAALLGRAKSGRTERKSVAKMLAARRNARRPPRKGRRPRGRPRRTGQSSP